MEFYTVYLYRASLQARNTHVKVLCISMSELFLRDLLLGKLRQHPGRGCQAHKPYPQAALWHLYSQCGVVESWAGGWGEGSWDGDAAGAPGQNSSKSSAPSSIPLPFQKPPLLNKTRLRAIGCPFSQDPQHWGCLISHACTWRGRVARTPEHSDATAGRGEVAGHKALRLFIFPVSKRNLKSWPHSEAGQGLMQADSSRVHPVSTQG